MPTSETWVYSTNSRTTPPRTGRRTSSTAATAPNTVPATVRYSTPVLLALHQQVPGPGPGHHLTTSPPHHLTTSPPHHLTTYPLNAVPQARRWCRSAERLVPSHAAERHETPSQPSQPSHPRHPLAMRAEVPPCRRRSTAAGGRSRARPE